MRQPEIVTRSSMSSEAGKEKGSWTFSAELAIEWGIKWFEKTLRRKDHDFRDRLHHGYVQH